MPCPVLKVVREDISQNAVHRVGKNFSSPWREIAGRKAILICLVSEKRAETAALIALLLEAGEAKTPRRNCSIGRRSRKHHFFRASFYHGAKIRNSAVLPLAGNLLGSAFPKPCYGGLRRKNISATATKFLGKFVRCKVRGCLEPARPHRKNFKRSRTNAEKMPVVK